ncbi:MAG: hypothetical protein ACKOEO_24665, partial [Planctomycetaceae bacterium]
MLRPTRNLHTLLLLLVITAPPAPLSANPRSPRADEPAADPQPADDLQRLPTDRAALRELQQLREAIDSRDVPAFRNSLRSLRAA